MADSRPSWNATTLADAILANGVAFLPDVAELDRLRRIEAAARAVEEYDAEHHASGGVGHRIAALRAALAREGSART